MGQDLRIRNDDGKSGRQITPLKGDGTVGGILGIALHDIFQQNCRVGFLKTRSMGSPVEFCQLNQGADRIIQVFSALMKMSGAEELVILGKSAHSWIVAAIGFSSEG